MKPSVSSPNPYHSPSFQCSPFFLHPPLPPRCPALPDPIFQSPSQPVGAPLPVRIVLQSRDPHPPNQSEAPGRPPKGGPRGRKFHPHGDTAVYDSLGRLKKLTDLDLAINDLNGSIPGSLSELTSVVQIKLYNNSLTGELPPGMLNLTRLRLLDASMNQLSGQIPDELCRLQLESLNLYENNFDGSLPESIVNSPNLYELRLFRNKLTNK